VIIREIQDVASVWKNTVALTFDPFVRNVMQSFGIPSAAVERIFQKDPGSLIPADVRSMSLLSTANLNRDCYHHLQSDWFKIQLQSGENLGKLEGKYKCFLAKALQWSSLSPDFTLSSKPNERFISLKGFTRKILGDWALKSFFGEKLFEVSPSFAPCYTKYEDDSWKIFYRYPRFRTRNLHQAKEKAITELVKYLELPEEQRPELAWIFLTMDKELSYLGLSPEERAGIIMMITWA
jgi:hypothetical protein